MATAPQTDTAKQVAAIQRRLEKFELDHLREHTTQLADQLEWQKATTARAESEADYWREQCESLIAQLNNQVGLAMDGSLHVLDGVDADAVHSRQQVAA